LKGNGNNHHNTTPPLNLTLNVINNYTQKCIEKYSTPKHVAKDIIGPIIIITQKTNNVSCCVCELFYTLLI